MFFSIKGVTNRARSKIDFRSEGRNLAEPASSPLQKEAPAAANVHSIQIRHILFTLHVVLVVD